MQGLPLDIASLLGIFQGLRGKLNPLCEPLVSLECFSLLFYML